MSSSKIIEKEHDVLEVIRKSTTYLKQKYKLSNEEIIELLKADIVVPVEIFRYLSPLESLVKYLKENLNFSYSKTGSVLNRDERTIWITYSNAVKKKRSKFKEEGANIPVKIFSDRNFSILESLCIYLEDLSIKEISLLLNKNPSSMWTVYKRALKKQGDLQ